MCGIAGVFFKSPKNSFPLRAAAELLKHRGPDDEGYVLLNPETNLAESRSGKDTDPAVSYPSIENPWPETRLAMAHRRLSILDLSACGHQPMADASGEYWVVHNGEIYNYDVLRSELQDAGVQFRSKTDTEVILEAYKKWGRQCLARFNGMWAFAVWDGRKRELFCARDRFGVKPFYYAQAGGDFFFASEIKALLAMPGVPRRPSEKAVWEYLALSAYPRHDETFFEGIKQIEPGSSLIIGESMTVRKEQWYGLPPEMGTGSYGPHAAEKFKLLLEDSVRLRLKSDVPVGSSLSGGLDSSAIVCLMAKKRENPVHAFSSCFENPAYDERKYLEKVLKKTGAEKHLVFPQAKDFWGEIESLVTQQDEPFGSTGLYAQWRVMREARAFKIPVLLDGQGADELLGGYPRYKVNRALSEFRRGNLLALFQTPLAFPASVFLSLPLSMRRKVLDFLPYKRFLRAEAAVKNSEGTSSYIAERCEDQTSLNRTLVRDLTRYKLPALLRYEDRNSMKFSVETRLPFLDYRLVEFAVGLEERAKIDDGVSKKILRDAMRGILPKEIENRRDKMGFVTPDKEWFNEGREFISKLFNLPEACAVSPWVDTRAFKDRAAQGGKWDLFFWRVVNLELWFKAFLT